MTISNPIHDHRDATYNLATALAKTDVYPWLVQYGYFPENDVLPPCFAVVKRPRPTVHFRVKKAGREYRVDRSEIIGVHFPKSELTDRTFGIMHPRIHNDIAFHIAYNWKTVVDAMVPKAVLKSTFGALHQAEIVEYLEGYLQNLSQNEERNKYLISWISYFLVSNDLKKHLKFKPKYKDPITRSIYNSRNALFKDCKEYTIFVGCRKIGKKVSMLEHLDVFNPPKGT